MVKIKWSVYRSADKPRLIIRASINLWTGRILVLKVLVPEDIKLNKFMSQTKNVRKHMRRRIIKEYESKP